MDSRNSESLKTRQRGGMLADTRTLTLKQIWKNCTVPLRTDQQGKPEPKVSFLLYNGIIVVERVKRIVGEKWVTRFTKTSQLTKQTHSKPF